MGAALSAPLPELTRHSKNRLVHRRPKPHTRRQKVPLEKGFSHMDWVRLTQKDADIAGLKGQRPRQGISLEEVALHCTEGDAWTVLRGRVYNMTAYLRFHPGGVPLLLRVAGTDGTALFDKYHPWVNADTLLEKCLVGYLEEAKPDKGSAPPMAPISQQQQQQEQQGEASLHVSSSSPSQPQQQEQQQPQQPPAQVSDGLPQQGQRQQFSSLPAPSLQQRCRPPAQQKELLGSIGLRAHASVF